MNTQIHATRAARIGSRPRFWWRGLLAAVAAAISNLLVWALAQHLFDLLLSVPAGPGSTELAPVSAGMVVVSSVVPALAATMILVLLYRFVSRPLLIFWVVSVLFLLVSFVPVISLPLNTGTRLVLGLMHIVAASVIVTLLTASPPEQ